MLLIKCKCKCFFTLPEDFFDSSNRVRCPNCKNDFWVGPEDPSILSLKQKLEEAEMSLRHIPDNAKMHISFDA